MQVDWFREKIPLNEGQVRNMMCKWLGKRMAKLKVQNIWNNLNELCSPNIFLTHSAWAEY